MQIDLTGNHIEITDALRNYVREKASRLARHTDALVEFHVVLTVEKLRHRAEATALVNGAKLHADAEEASMYAAIDALTDKLDRQIIRLKEKRIQH